MGRSERDVAWFAARRAVFIERYGDQISAELRRLVDHAELLQARANQRLAAAAPTLLHADLHLDNVLFDRASGHPIVLDWARVARGPAVFDLTELLFEIGQPGDREQLLATYLATLREGGVRDYDEARLRTEIGGALLRRVIARTYGVARTQPDLARVQPLIRSGLVRME